MKLIRCDFISPPPQIHTSLKWLKYVENITALRPFVSSTVSHYRCVFHWCITAIYRQSEAMTFCNYTASSRFHKLALFQRIVTLCTRIYPLNSILVYHLNMWYCTLSPLLEVFPADPCSVSSAAHSSSLICRGAPSRRVAARRPTSHPAGRGTQLHMHAAAWRCPSP